MKSTFNIGKLYFITALVMLCIGLLFGVLSAQVYTNPEFLKSTFGFQTLRPLHVSSVMFWILLGATACIYSSLSFLQTNKVSGIIAIIQWFLWMIAIAIGIWGGTKWLIKKWSEPKIKYDEDGYRIWNPEPKQDSIIVSFVKASYNKYCPRIEWNKNDKK